MSHLFLIARSGPVGQNSTYAEYWGQTAKYDARFEASSNDLAALPAGPLFMACPHNHSEARRISGAGAEVWARKIDREQAMKAWSELVALSRYSPQDMSLDTGAAKLRAAMLDGSWLKCLSTHHFFNREDLNARVEAAAKAFL